MAGKGIKVLKKQDKSTFYLKVTNSCSYFFHSLIRGKALRDLLTELALS